MLSLLLVVVMAFTLLPTVSHAAEIVDSGTCGANLTWTLDSEGLLTISGTGDMTDYSSDYYLSNEYSPFHSFAKSITTVVLEDGITSIGGFAFYSSLGGP